jgi:hypothetical protein
MPRHRQRRPARKVANIENAACSISRIALATGCYVIPNEPGASARRLMNALHYPITVAENNS